MMHVAMLKRSIPPNGSGNHRIRSDVTVTSSYILCYCSAVTLAVGNMLPG